MNDDKLIQIINGDEKKYDIYFTFVCKETKLGYIGYTDHSLDENGKEKLIVSTYDPFGDTSKLGEIQTQEEWDLVYDVMDKIRNFKKKE